MKLLGIILLKNKSLQDLTNTAIEIPAKHLIKKYNTSFIIIDEENRQIPFIIYKNKLIIFPYLLPSETETVLRIVQYKNAKKKAPIRNLDKNHKKLNLVLGKRIEVVKRYPFSFGHIQGIIRLGDYIFITSVDKKEKVGYLIKTEIKKDNISIIDKMRLKFDDVYHPSGICDDFYRKKIYLAVAQYKPTVTKPTKILEIDANTLEYNIILEVEDHIGSVCVDKNNMYLFSWDGERMYIYSKDGEFIGAVFRREWGRVQDCDVLYDKIYATSQNEDKIYVIDTKKWRAVESIYTPKGLTNEGFDIDHKKPNIFWFAPDDGYIYKTRYRAVYGYNIKIRNPTNVKIQIENRDKAFIYIDKTIALMKVLGKEFSLKHRSDEIDIKISKNKISVYTKDAKFRINVNENIEFDRYKVSIVKDSEEIEIFNFAPRNVEAEIKLF